MSKDSMEYLGSLISNSSVLKYMTMKMASSLPDVDFIAANAPTGMVPAWQLRYDLGELYGLTIGSEISFFPINTTNTINTACSKEWKESLRKQQPFLKRP